MLRKLHNLVPDMLLHFENMKNSFQSYKLYDILSLYVINLVNISSCIDFYIISGLLQFLHFLYFSSQKQEKGR